MEPITDPRAIIKKCIELFKNGDNDSVYLVVETDEYTIHFLNNGDMKYIEENSEALFDLDGDINEFVDTFEDIFSVFLVDTLIDNTEFLHEAYIQNQDIFFGCVDKHIVKKHELLVSLENQNIRTLQINLIKELQDTLLQEKELLRLEKDKKIESVSQKELNDLIVSNVERNLKFGAFLNKTVENIIDEPYYKHCKNELSLINELYFLLEKQKRDNENEKQKLGLNDNLSNTLIKLELEIVKIKNEKIKIQIENTHKEIINERSAKSFRKLGGLFKTVNRANRDLSSGENVSFGKTRSDISYLKGLKC
jgi:hypothetical protein